MKMRYYVLISGVMSIIMFDILSDFIEIWASLSLSIFTWSWMIVIVKIGLSELSQNPDFKDVILMCIAGLVGVYSEVFGIFYKGEKPIMLSIILAIIFTICLLILFLTWLKHTK